MVNCVVEFLDKVAACGSGGGKLVRMFCNPWTIPEGKGVSIDSDCGGMADRKLRTDASEAPQSA